MKDFPLITSRKNTEVRAAAALADSAAERKKQGLFLAEGARLCEDAAKSGVTIRKVFVTDAALQKYAVYLAPVLRQAREVYRVEEHVAELLADTRHTQGVFCLCETPAARETRLAGKWAALEKIQDPSNLGTIMRTAEALGLAGLLLVGGCDAFSPKVIRASMGAAFRLPLLFCADIMQAARLPGMEEMACFAAVPEASAKPLGSFPFPENAVVFIGNEGGGLSEEAVRFCGQAITIPMKGRAESLNAAAAAAICLWEAVK